MLLLRGRAPDSLTQDTVKEILAENFGEVSVSTISRTLEKLERANYCKFTIKGKRRVKHYYTTSNFKSLILERFKAQRKDFEMVSSKLKEISRNMVKEEINDKPDLVMVIKELTNIYELTIDAYYEFEANIIKKVENLDLME